MSRSYLLDGDNARHGLNRDLGFPRMTGSKTFAALQVAALSLPMLLIVVTAFISAVPR
ncbi:MAG: adenylyl-sulfate kinase [Gammaproteobacteria bacterium]|nr:adenylyl-sulfate kinase [Gammaproteobacteria bacterium]